MLNDDDIAVIEFLDDGTLYAAPNIIEEILSYSDLSDSFLLVSRDKNGTPTGYIPLGINSLGNIASYIPAIPPSPPISPTYTPGAENVIRDLDNLLSRSILYFDVDVVPYGYGYFDLEETASAYCLSLDDYFSELSSSRRKDFKRKLKSAEKYEIEQGNMKDVLRGWNWMKAVWEKRGAYDSDHINRVLSWLYEIEASGRATMKIDKYLLDGKPIAVNCCVIHQYHGNTHIDDYLTWYDVATAPGLGIVTAIKNLTNPKYIGARYNLGLPGFYGNTFAGHQYKWDVIAEPIRLYQSIVNLQVGIQSISSLDN